MTEKRFIIKESTITEGYGIFDLYKKYAFVPVDKKAQLEPTVKVLNALHEENEDHKYLCSIYVDFLVSKGYELADVIEYSKEMEE